MSDEGIHFRVPNGWTATSNVAATAGRGGRSGAESDPLDAFLAAAATQELLPESDRTVALGQAVGGRGATNFGDAQESSTNDIEVDVELQPTEEAAALVEVDGILSWHFPDPRPDPGVAAAVGGRGGDPAPTARSRATIRIPVSHSGSAAGARMSDLFGISSLSEAVAKVADKALRIVVFRFAGKLVTQGVVRLLERNIAVGPVVIDRDACDAATLETRWKQDQARLTRAAAALPKHRPARVLLLCHGTFSSVAGSFGALTSHDEGRAFLSRAVGTAAAPGHYDLVLGYDHRTLSDSPVENAEELLGVLRACDFAHPPQIDAIAFSRGGLVLRSLLELLLPNAAFPHTIGQCVFVGCTNDGTLLASPAGWRDMLDRFTTLAIAASRLVSLSGAPAAAAAIAASSATIAGFVRSLATAATDPSNVPGLAAMSPEGDFVRTLQAQQPGQPVASASRYLVIEAAFNPTAALAGARDDEEARRQYGMTQSLLLALASVATNAAWREANDLVVHTASMGNIEGPASGFVKDRLSFGQGQPLDGVYHTVYFTRREVASQLTQWLLDARDPQR
jgi:hypothetical protein